MSRPQARSLATLREEQDFKRFFIAHWDEVLGFAHRQAGPGLDVENIVAEAWARVYVNWNRISAPRPWVYRVVINLIRHAAADGKRTSPSGDPETGHTGRVTWASTSQPPSIDWAMRIADISRSLQRLPVKQRAAVLLSYQGLTTREIATTLECSPATVRVHLHFGRTRLRKLLAEPAFADGREPTSGLEGRTA